MYGYEHLRNIDGLSHIFIQKYYKYETLPKCPDCGSNYLYCDVKKQMCVSRDKKACDIPQVIFNNNKTNKKKRLHSRYVCTDSVLSLILFQM